MAVKDTEPMGIRHVTVVPTNFDVEDEDEEPDPEDATVPRHR